MQLMDTTDRFLIGIWLLSAVFVGSWLWINREDVPRLLAALIGGPISL